MKKTIVKIFWGKSAPLQQPGRIEYLDGIRGIASVLVIFCHLSCVFLPELYFYRQDASPLIRLFINSPLNVLTNGNAAVHCFFVLSGFLIARKIYVSNSDHNILDPVKQYIKLVKIVFPAILLAAVLMRCGLMLHLKAAELNPKLNFVLDYNSFTPTFLNTFIKDPFINVFIRGSVYVGPFWTIRYEFYGALLITAISYIAKDHVKTAKISYIIYGLIFALICPNIVSFIIGAFVFDCIDRKNTDESLLGKIIDWFLSKRIFAVFIFIIGIYFGCINHSLTGIWSPINHLPDFVHGRLGIFRAFGFGVCLLCICRSSALQKALSTKPLKWLGSISAYTYGFHWPVILSLGCGSFLLLSKTSLPYGVIVLIVSVFVLTATFILSVSYTKLIPFIKKYITCRRTQSRLSTS